MSTYLRYHEEEDRGYDQLKQEEKELIPWSDEECERTIPRKKEMRHICELVNGQCFKCGEMDRKIDFAKPQDVSKDWARLFLEQWNRAVKLWNGGKLFQPVNAVHARAIEIARRGGYTPDQTREQVNYAFTCCVWLIPNGFVEPHVLAHDMPEGCDCFHCILGL